MLTIEDRIAQQLEGMLPAGVNTFDLAQRLMEGKSHVDGQSLHSARATLLMNGIGYVIEVSNPSEKVRVTQTPCNGLVFDGQNWVVKR